MGGTHLAASRATTRQEGRLHPPALRPARRNGLDRPDQDGARERRAQRRGDHEEGALLTHTVAEHSLIIPDLFRQVSKEWLEIVRHLDSLRRAQNADWWLFQRARSQSASTTATLRSVSSQPILLQDTATSRSVTRTTSPSPKGSTSPEGARSRNTTTLCGPPTQTTASRSRTRRLGDWQRRTTTRDCSRRIRWGSTLLRHPVRVADGHHFSSLKA